MRALQDLEARFGRDGGVTFAEMFGGPVAILTACGARVIVAIQGAQVLSYESADGKEVLWLSPAAKLGTGKAVRGGIPICWPWFGPHPEDASKPAHGFVRAVPWQVVGSASSEGRARLILAFDATKIDPALWPHKARAEIEVTLDEALTVSLSTTNAGSASLRLTEALHTYVRVGDIGAVTVSGLAGRGYVDQLRPETANVQSADIAFDGEVDRIYQDTPDDVVVSDAKSNRCIRISKSGSLSTVVWNPWIEKSARLGDMGNNGYRHMLCVETANAGNKTVALAKGECHRIMTKISVEPL